MIKILSSSKDTYITNKIINGVMSVHSNVGKASTLDLYKLFGENKINSVPVCELTRLLIKFDLSPARTLVSQNKIDLNDSSFNATLQLFDVYGGQPTPENFTVNLYPLSQSFDEGRGKDIVRYADYDSCNFYTASYPNNLWNMSGAGASGSIGEQCDYLTTLNSQNDLLASQFFTTGEENLSLNVTKIISATLTNQISDNGFRISFSDEIENDTRSYFVKRFAGRNAYNANYHPKLIIKYNDSVNDESRMPEFDVNNDIFYYNYTKGALANLPNVGENSIKLKLMTPISGGYYELLFSGSQLQRNGQNIVGIYTSSVYVSSSNVYVKQHLALTGSVDFTPVWLSQNEELLFSGSTITFVQSSRTNKKINHNLYTVTLSGLKQVVSTNERLTVRVNVFDYTSPLIKFVKRPIEFRGLVLRDLYYQIKDCETGNVVIPFDTTHHSNKISSDYDGMYFELDTSNLLSEHFYTIDILLHNSENDVIYHNVSSPFKVKDVVI